MGPHELDSDRHSDFLRWGPPRGQRPRVGIVVGLLIVLGCAWLLYRGGPPGYEPGKRRNA